MRFRNLALGIAAVGVLAVGTASPSPAAPAKFEGTIAIPSAQLSNELAGGATVEDLRMTCPEPGDGDGIVYKFFDLKADYTKFKVYSPAELVNEQDPTGDPAELTRGTITEYDVDLYAFNAKCQRVEADGSLLGLAGNGIMKAARPARYIAINYFAGPHLNLPIVVEASNDK